MGKLCLMLVFLYICGLFVLLAINTKNDTLVLVHILFRHGERSPSKTYTNDPHKEYKWPGGWDQLSTRGKLEEYELGLAFRKRYADFLPDIYHQNDILIQSSYADRCIMSAQLLLAGLYPPKKDQIWNKGLLWQPVPVHSIPRYIDNKIAIKQECKQYKKLLSEMYSIERIRNITNANKSVFEYLTLHTGDNISNLFQLETLFNTLQIEEINGLILPKWTEDVYPHKMVDLAALSLAVYSENSTMKRLHGGILVKEIIQQMEDKVANKLYSDKKMFLYSGHDLTVVTLLRVLGFEKLLKPDFGAAVIVELHTINGEHFVKFFYKSSPNADATEMLLESCGINCKLNYLHTILKDVIPVDWDKECNK